MPKRRTLTAKQKTFVKEYLSNGNNASRAWLVVAGRDKNMPTDKRIRRAGMEMLHSQGVERELAKHEAKSELQIREAAAKMHITKELILDELARIAFARPTDVAEWDEEGKVKYKNSGEISDDAKASIAEVQGGPKGGLKIRHHDKKDALIQLGKHLGLFTDSVKHEHTMKSVNFIITKD